jgi:PHD/YefM family antitoxin component YafN of YafNO toxin-antitoxin module
MHQIQLADELYQQAERRAGDAGYASVDEYIADVLADYLADGPDDFDRLFTPERLAHIDAELAKVKAGHFLTTEESDAELAKRRAEWLQKHPR